MCASFEPILRCKPSLRVIIECVYIQLVDISERLILAIGQPGPLGVIRCLILLLPLCSTVPALVLPHIVEEEDERKHGCRRLRREDCNLSRAIFRRISRLERLRADDVSDREGAGHERTGKRTLGMARAVGRRPLIQDRESGDDGIDEVNPNENTCFVVLGEEGKQTATEDAGEGGGDQPGPAMGDSADPKADEESEEDAHNARGHIEQRCVGAREAESGNQGCRVRGHHSTGDGDLRDTGVSDREIGGANRTSEHTYQHGDYRNEPQLNVAYSLPDLFYVKVTAPHPGLVDADVVQKGDLLAVGQPLCLHRRVGQEEEGQCASNGRDQPENKEHDAPALEGWILDMLEAKGDQTTQDLCHPQTDIPQRESGRRFAFGVVLTAQQHQRRTNRRLKDAEEDASDQKSGIVTGARTGRRSNPPEKDICSEPFGWRSLLQKNYWRTSRR